MGMSATLGRTASKLNLLDANKFLGFGFKLFYLQTYYIFCKQKLFYYIFCKQNYSIYKPERSFFSFLQQLIPMDRPLNRI